MTPENELRLKACLAVAQPADPTAKFGLKRWIWSLRDHGRTVLVAAGCAAARAALPVWESHADPDSNLRSIGDRWVGDLLVGAEITRNWTSYEDIAKFRATLDGFRPRLTALEAIVDEASGSANICRARDKALAAARATFFAAQTAAWNPTDVMSLGLSDDAETSERIAAGPAHEAAEACTAACDAIGCSDDHMRTIIQQSLLRFVAN